MRFFRPLKSVQFLLLAEVQTVNGFYTVIVQHECGIIGLACFLGEDALNWDFAVSQQSRCHLLCQRDFLSGEKLVITPQTEAAIVYLAEKAFLLSVTLPPQRGHFPTTSRPDGNRTSAPLMTE